MAIVIDFEVLKSAVLESKIDVRNQYQLCLFIATFVFANVRDKGNVDYVQHCIRVASNPRLIGRILAQCMALLHDVIEDSNITDQNLIDLGVDSYVIAGLKYLTHTPDLSYNEYIDRMVADYLKFNGSPFVILFTIVEDAISVKLSDMEDNSQLSRLVLGESDEKSITRISKYIVNYKKLIKAIYGYYSQGSSTDSESE